LVKETTTKMGTIIIVKDAPQEFLEWFRNELQTRNWGIREAAQRVGVSHPTISEIVTYEKQPSYETCIAIASALGQRQVFILRLAGLLEKEIRDREANLSYKINKLPDEDQDVIDVLVDTLLVKRGILDERTVENDPAKKAGQMGPA
jgi:plasmid maintenance system antidote protein VapI